MKTAVAVTIAALGFAGLVAWTYGGEETGVSAERVPVLAELFTSEGCSSCPPADDLLRRLVAEQPVDGVEVIALSEHVDYWDRLGWKDPFSSPRFTERQQAYTLRFRIDSIYTPQLVIDGRFEEIGSDWPAVRKALAQAARAPRARVQAGVERSRDGDSASVRVVVRDAPLADAGSRAVLIAVVEDGLVTDVQRGENARRRLRHAAVVRALEPAGDLDAAAASGEFEAKIRLDPSWDATRLRVVAFVQDLPTQVVVGAGAWSVALKPQRAPVLRPSRPAI